MIGFSYIYKTSDEILSSVSHLSSMNLWDIIGLIIVLTVLYVVTSVVGGDVSVPEFNY